MNMGMPPNTGKRGGGSARNYYRQKQPYGQQQQRPNQGGHYSFPAAMYDAPYGMAPQYPQAYAPNMHMGMPQQGQGGNPSGVGAPSGYYGQHGQYMPDMAAFSASAASYPSTQ